MTEEFAGLPSPRQVIELLETEFARLGCEVEDVAIDTRTRPPRITVVADGDKPLDLDAIAELSRSASELMDGLDTADDGYVLEVTSPGVDRPLTAEKHFRRARARLVHLDLADDSTLIGRLGAVGDGIVNVIVRDRKDWSVRPIPLADIRKAVVQVEFSPPNARELELVDDPGQAAGTEAEA